MRNALTARSVTQTPDDVAESRRRGQPAAVRKPDSSTRRLIHSSALHNASQSAQDRNAGCADVRAVRSTKSESIYRG